MKRTVISDSIKFEKIIQQFEDSLSNIKVLFQSEKSNIENINQTPIWNGPTQDVIYNKHIEYQKNFQTIEDALQIYIDFLKKTLSDYERLEATLNKNMEEATQELTVN